MSFTVCFSLCNNMKAVPMVSSAFNVNNVALYNNFTIIIICRRLVISKRYYMVVISHKILVGHINSIILY